MRITFNGFAKAVGVCAIVAMPVSFVSGLLTSSQDLPNLFKNAAHVIVDVPNDLGRWTRTTAIPFILDPLG